MWEWKHIVTTSDCILISSASAINGCMIIVLTETISRTDVQSSQYSVFYDEDCPEINFLEGESSRTATSTVRCVVLSAYQEYWGNLC